jgi:hypothetical protein
MRKTTRAIRRPGRPLACAALAAVCLGAPATAMGADKPGRLLEAYPLEQRPATVAGTTAAPTPAPVRAPAVAAPDPPGFSQTTAIAIAAAAMLLAGAVVVRPRRRAAAAAATAGPAMLPFEGADVSVDDEAPVAVADPPRRGITCQIHWEREDDASWFEARTQGRDRVTIAVSPEFDWDDPRVPPDRTPDAKAALRELVDELSEAGWTPVRGRGRESGAPRWYARRFETTASVDDDTEET